MRKADRPASPGLPQEPWQPIETYSDDGEVVVWNGQPHRAYYQDPDGWFADVNGELLRIEPPPTHWVRPPVVEPWKDPDMIQICLGCGRPTDLDCGCPAGTAWRKSSASVGPRPPVKYCGHDGSEYHYFQKVKGVNPNCPLCRG